MPLQIVATQTLPGGHTVIYFRNTESTEPVVMGDAPGVTLARLASDPKDLEPLDAAELAAVNNALHAHRAKVVRDVAAKEEHNAALGVAIEERTVEREEIDARVAALKGEHEEIGARVASLSAEFAALKGEHEEIDARVASLKVEHAAILAMVPVAVDDYEPPSDDPSRESSVDEEVSLDDRPVDATSLDDRG